MKYLLIIAMLFCFGCDKPEPTADPNTTLPINKTFRWTPTADQVGTHHITFTATDSKGASVSKTITIIVTLDPNTNEPTMTVEE